MILVRRRPYGVNALIVSVAVTPPSNSIVTTWWSATSLSQAYTQRPYGPSHSARRTPCSVRSVVTTDSGHCFRFGSSRKPRDKRVAEYGQVDSTAQSRQRSAAPGGRLGAVKWCRLA